jgi:hypothetical protein
MAHEQRHAHPFLERSDLLAERRLADEQASRRVAHVTLFGYRREVAEQSQFDGHLNSLTARLGHPVEDHEAERSPIAKTSSGLRSFSPSLTPASIPGTTRDLGEPVLVVAKVRELSLQRPEELVRGVCMQRWGAAARSNLHLHDEEAAGGCSYRACRVTRSCIT